MLLAGDRCFGCAHLRFPWELGANEKDARNVLVRSILAYCVSPIPPSGEVGRELECVGFQEMPSKPVQPS